MGNLKEEKSTEEPIASAIWSDVDERVEGGYRVTSQLAESALSRTFVATRFGRKVIMKTLSEELMDDPMHRELLLKEFEIQMSLSHEGVARALCFDDTPEYGPCLTMEYVDGCTLHEFLATKPSRRTKLRILCELLDVLKYIHAKGIVHRDLKPTNILITTEGEHVRLIDFGLSDSDGYLILKQAAGTEGYASPEQREGGDADPRNDIYSVGRIMQDMQLGLAYRSIIATCMGPLEKRYTAASLRRAVSRVPWLYTLVPIAIVLLALVLFLSHPSQEPLPSPDIPESQPTDECQIGTAEELIAYARKVSAGEDVQNAILTADIDLKGCEWVMIGTFEHPFTKEFNGQGHRILNLHYCDTTADNVGMFGAIGGGALLHNFILDRTCHIEGRHFVGMVGSCPEGNTVKIEDVGNEGTVRAHGLNAGSIIGSFYSCHNTSLYISRCYSTGDVIGDQEAAQICGWAGGRGHFVDSWSTSRLQGRDEDRGMIRKVPEFGSVNNFTTEVHRTGEGIEGEVPLEDFRSGKVAFRINRFMGYDVWFQTLGQDSLPTLSPSSKNVYASIVLDHGQIVSLTCSNDSADQQVTVLPQ